MFLDDKYEAALHEYLEFLEENKTDLKKYKILEIQSLPYFKLKTKKIKSKKFIMKVQPTLKRMPNYEEKIDSNDEPVYMFKINTIEEYIKYGHNLYQIVEYFRGRKNSKIYIADDLKSENILSFRQFTSEMQEVVQDHTGYGVKPFPDNNIGYNILSLHEFDNAPIILYPPNWGTFFAFSDEYHTQPHFCTCQKKAVINFVELVSHESNYNQKNIMRKEFSKEVIKYVTEPSDLINNFEFKENVCHKCNQIMPKYLTINPMYSGNKFEQRCHPYIKQKFVEMGYSLSKSDRKILPVIKGLFPVKWLEHIETSKELNDMVENIVREEFDLYKKGEYWLSETYMGNLIEKLYPTEKVIRHYRPDWLEGLELDIYIPSQKIGFEYNGLQHYEPVAYFGGSESFKRQIERDRRKKELCRQNEVKLIVIKYDEDLSRELLIEKIDEVLNI